MVGEEHSIHVPDFSLIPIGSFVDFIARINRRQLVGVGLDANSRVVAKREKIVDDLESVWARWNIHSSDVDEIFKLGLVVVLEELQYGENTLGSDENFQLVSSRQLHLLNVLGQAFGDVFSEVCQS